MANKDYIREPRLVKIYEKFEGRDNFIIPPYQRNYSWTRDRIISFWDELLIPENKSEFRLSFSGSIILKHNNESDPKNQYEIIDGQQRFITVAILLAVIRDYSRYLVNIKYKKNKSESEKFLIIVNDINKMLNIKTGWTKEQQPRIRVGRIIKDYFDKIIINENDYEKNHKTTLTALDNDSEKNILRNYKTFAEKLIDYISFHFDEDNERETIIKVLQSLEQIEVISIPVTDDVAAYEIFETVNSKNEPLTSSDLIKNQILRNLDQNEDYEKSWNDSIQNIAQIDGFNFNQFLRYFWISKYGWSTDKKLYANFKYYLNEKFKNKKDRSKFLKNFLDEVLINSYHFRRLMNPGYDNYFTSNYSSTTHYDKRIIASLNSIKSLGVKQCYVLLLSLIRNSSVIKDKFNDQSKFSSIARSISLLFKEIEIFSLSFHVLGKGQANKVEKAVYHNFSIEIEKFINHEFGKKQFSIDKFTSKWSNALKNKIILKLRKILEDEMVDMDIQIGKLDYRKKLDYFIIKFIYQKITQFNYNQKNLSFNENATQEHILPKDPTKWGLTANEINDYVNNIGNIIIIDGALNKKLGNRTLQDKIYGFKRNDVKISYFEDKNNYNKNLYNQIKNDLDKKEFSKNGTKYWTKERIEQRAVSISKEFQLAVSKYLND